MQTPNIQGTTSVGSNKLVQVGAAPKADASFQALLEKLEQKADGLAGRQVSGAQQLSGAVDEARSTLNDALDLGRDLLEAYRKVRLDKAG